MSQRSQIGPAATDIAKSQHDPYLPGLRLAKTLLVLAPWTIAIPTNFYGICALHVVALGFLVVSVRQGALSRLNGIAASIIVLILSALLLTLIITAAGVDRSYLVPALFLRNWTTTSHRFFGFQAHPTSVYCPELSEPSMFAS